MYYKLVGGKRGQTLNDKAMCNQGLARTMCSTTQWIEGSSGTVVLTCNLLSPHNGSHHDQDAGVYWREDSVRMKKGGWKDGKRPAWMKEEDQYE